MRPTAAWDTPSTPAITRSIQGITVRLVTPKTGACRWLGRRLCVSGSITRQWIALASALCARLAREVDEVALRRGHHPGR